MLRNKLVDHRTFKTRDEARTAIFAYIEGSTIVSSDLSRWISFVGWNIKA